MSRKAVLSAMVAVVTGGTLMLTGPAFAASKPTPAPVTAAQAAKLGAGEARAAAEMKKRGNGLTAKQRLALAMAVKEGKIAVPLSTTARFTG